MSRSPELASGPALASKIERACAQAGVFPTQFGRQAVNDPRLVSDLKRGRELRQKTLVRVHEALTMLESGLDTSFAAATERFR